MAAISWLEVGDQFFSSDEARSASDFYEVLLNFELSSEVLYGMFKDEALTLPKRLVLTQMLSIDDVAKILLKEEDKRIIVVIQHRLREARENGDSMYQH